MVVVLFVGTFKNWKNHKYFR